MTPGARSIPVLLAALALALLPLGTGSFGIDLATKIMIFAIFALSLELLVGTTGLVCFGQAAFFGLAGYTAVLLSPSSEPAALWWLLPAAVGVAALYALFMGALSLRTRGVYFIMVTLAFAQMAYYVVHDTPLGGGTDGIYMNVKPVAAIGGTVLLDLGGALPMYYAVFGCLVLVFGFLALLLRSPFGRALAGIKANEQRMRATGFSTYPYKLAAFVISGAIAGIAGFLFAVKDGFVNPELMAWHQSGAVLIMIILGGLGHLRGAVLGAFAYALLEELFRSEAVFGNFAKHWHLGLGLTIIASVALLPRGLIGIGAQMRRRLAGAGGESVEEGAATSAESGTASPSPSPSPTADGIRTGTGTGTGTGTPSATAHGAATAAEALAADSAAPVLLRARGLTRRWGGLVAVDGVSLELQRGAVHAVIGTNGAGKSTLIEMLSGGVAPSAGTVELLGQDVTAWPQPRRARAGLGRSYQRNTVYPGFSVEENCRLAAQALHQRPWRWWRNAARDPQSLAAARAAAAQAGLGDLLGRLAGLLSHGQKRQLEVAMCLAISPRVLLLDEPLAGMGAEETDRMLALLASLRERHAILLVEHDMDAVFRIADRITVMVNGTVIASGTPQAIRADAQVRAAYLGDDA